MFWRIELIDEMSAEKYRNFIEAMRGRTDDPRYNLEKEYPRDQKSGTVGYSHPAVAAAWLGMNSPRHNQRLNSNNLCGSKLDNFLNGLTILFVCRLCTPLRSVPLIH
jgi:hypothetical protein